MGSGKYMNLFEVANEMVTRLSRICLRDKCARRPVFGGAIKFQNDPYLATTFLFYEYFHSESGAGLGASHQTEWTGMIATLLHLTTHDTPESALGAPAPVLMPSHTGPTPRHRP